MRLGQFEIYPVETGKFALDGGAMFGVVPKVFWERTNPPDEKNRISLALRPLLIKTHKRIILVDTGIGDKNDDKFKSIYGVNPNNVGLQTSLSKLGFSLEDVSDVVITHLHFDHCGGSTIIKDGKVVPTFPNAKYYIQNEHLEWALNPSEKDKASFLKENFMPIKEFNQLEILEGNFKLDEGIEIILSDGHTPAQQHLKLTSENKTLFYCGDMIPTSSHIPFPYVMGYDLYPLITIEEKK
ncbi:MAG: MBL fold metallo-hydrolase, partial [Ignavibacteria bacterium]|nr:MBL fold metallo-hydrolase [Ignavibacteria bacterium]